MLINSKEVKISVLDGKHEISYFACTCSEKDLDFWEHELSNFKLQEGVECDITSLLIMELGHTYSADVCGIGVDMWFGIRIKSNYLGKDLDLYIKCDQIPYGLLCAIMIIRGYE